MSKKVLGSRDAAEARASVGDLVTFGDSDIWRLVCKASSKQEGWMKSTKAMELGWGRGWWRSVRIALRWLLPCPGGVLVQVTTQQGDQVAEAVTFCAGAVLVEVGRIGGKCLWEIR